MKATLVYILLLLMQLVIAAAALSAEIIKPEVEIKRVELFRSGAQVFKKVQTRKALPASSPGSGTWKPCTRTTALLPTR